MARGFGQMADKCNQCGLPEEDHHDFMERLGFPKECVCDKSTWVPGALNVYDICSFYNSLDGDGACCDTCYHDEECHGECYG